MTKEPMNLKPSVEIVDLDLIQANPNQPRTDSFGENELLELAQTIKQVGIIHPPLVRKISDTVYELIAGERRFRAAKLAGLKQIPVIVKNLDDDKSSLAALIENIQRVDLNPIEQAKAIKTIANQMQLTHEELSETLGLKRASLTNLVRLLSLPEIIQKALINKEITTGHAKVILSLQHSKDQITLFQMIVRGKSSVRDAEKLALKMDKKQTPLKKPESRSGNIFLKQIQESLQKKWGTKVEFSGSEKQGIIQLHYYSLSDLNRLLNAIGYSEES